MGIVKYLMKRFAEARIYLSDFIRVMDAAKTVDSVDYVIALELLGELHRAESRYEDAKKLWRKAKSILEQNPSIGEKIPELEELISTRLETAQAAPTETKSLFSRFTELARFEDEQVSREVPIEERIDELLQSYVFVDDQ
jgi:tetratricopeptide (TPR) repeat protein